MLFDFRISSSVALAAVVWILVLSFSQFCQLSFENLYLGQAGYVKVNHHVNSCGGVHLTPPSQPLIVDVIPNRLEVGTRLPVLISAYRRS
jgi:hypothetical protein